jgi:putative nucleotidyltransferase with HDIG domain
MLSFQELVDHADNLGVHPETMAMLVEAMEDPTVGSEKLLPVVETDPILTARMLRIVNSPVYGMRREVDSTREALVRLGNVAFCRLVFLISTEQLMLDDLKAYDITGSEFRKHSLAVALAASRLASVLGHPEKRAQAFTAGMLHDCGKLLLDSSIVGRVPFLAQGGHGRIDPAVEIAFTGYDHGKAAAGLLSYWGLPQTIVQAVRCHHNHNVAGDYSSLAGLVWAADMIVHLARDGAVLDPDNPASPYQMFLDQGMSPIIVQQVIDSIPVDELELISQAAKS